MSPIQLIQSFGFSDPHIEREQAELSADRLQLACETFGHGRLPQLQSAVYKVKSRVVAGLNVLSGFSQIKQ